MELERPCSATFALEKMVCSVVLETALANQKSLLWVLLMSAPLGTNAFPDLEGAERRFPVGDLKKVSVTASEAKDASEMEDDEDEDEGEDNSDDGNDEDDDYSGEESDDEVDSEDDAGATGTGGSDEDEDDDDDDEDDDDDDDDDEDDGEDDNEEQPPSKKKK